MGEGASTGKVRAGFFSFTEVTDPSAHRSYNEWHQLDHMPEQYPIPGIIYGQRWVSTPACRAGRAVSGERLAPVHYLTMYLMSDPLDQTLRDFYALGKRLRAENRFHLQRVSHLSGPFDVLATAAAPRVLVSAEAVPYRPCRGVYVVVEERLLKSPVAEDAFTPAADHETVSDLLDVDGVAGVWVFGAAKGERITVCFVDGDVGEVSTRMRTWPVGERSARKGYQAILAGPFETITPWEWDWFDGDTGAPR